MMKKAAQAAVFFQLIAMVLLLSSCGGKVHTRQQAESMASQYMMYLQQEEYAKAVMLFSPKVRDSAREQLQKISDKLGHLKQYRMLGKEINTVFSGKYFLFEYGTEYEKYSKVDAKYTRNTATDVLTLFYSLSDKTLYIVSHAVESEGLHS